MRLHNEGRREVAALRSMCCVCILSFEFRLFLSSPPCRARRCVPQCLCVWWMKLGHFFPALLSLSVRGSIQRYTKWWLETHGFIPAQHLFLWLGVAPRSDWCLYHLLSSRHASLHCQARVCLDKFGQRRISLWCVLFHAMFVFLSVCAQAHSLYFVVYQLNFSRDNRNAYAFVNHVLWVEMLKYGTQYCQF